MEHKFTNDYSELAHPLILKALSDAGNKQFTGYGLDECSAAAAGLIKEKFAVPSADVHFIAGGTHANLTVISSALRPHEAVISAASGHICVHEAGSIEATGHKICTAEAADGKLRPSDIRAIADGHTDEHMVKPKLVYISQASETGTVYSKAELSAISEACRKNGLYLFIDGARLGTALAGSGGKFGYADIASAADVFYVGGTKNGAMFGEAVVIVNDALKSDFRFILKQKGAMIAKGAAIGIQFKALFEGGLYEQLAGHACAMAAKMAGGIAKAGYSFLYPVESNMLFPTFPADVADRLREDFGPQVWQMSGGAVTLRLVTSWATPECAVDEFIKALLS